MGLAYVVIEEIPERVTADMEGKTETSNSIFNKLKINWFRVCHVPVFFLNTWKHWRMFASTTRIFTAKRTELQRGTERKQSAKHDWGVMKDMRKCGKGWLEQTTHL